MIKYKVSFEITDEVIGCISSNRKQWIRVQKQLIEDYIYEMERAYQGFGSMKVTDFRIEENG